MFKMDEKHFMPCTDPAGTFPPEKPRYTMTEEVEHTAREMKNTIDRLLRFEKRVEAKFEDLMKHLTSDNVIFKNTFAEAYNSFLMEVKNEVNVFEGNVDSSITLFKSDLESNYANIVETLRTDYNGLSEECRAQITDYYNQFMESLNEAKTTMNNAHDAYRDAMEARLEQHNDTYIASFNNFTTQTNTKIANIDRELSLKYSEFVGQVTQSINDFQTAWTAEIDARLDGQDSKINDAILFMKTNMSDAVTAYLDAMVADGEMDVYLKSGVFAEFSKKVEHFVTPENFGAVGDGVADDTEAFNNAVASGKAVHAYGTYKVTSVTLPKYLNGTGSIVGTVNVSELNSRFEGITFKGTINWNARNCYVENCHFNECAFNLTSWANCFVNCNWWKSPIYFAPVNGATNNFIGCYFGNAEKQFHGTPSNIHITNGWIEECTKILEVNNGGTIFGITFENCDIESCECLVNCTGGVYASPLTFSNCVILGNSITTKIVGTDGSTTATNRLSVKMVNCYFENVKDFENIGHIQLGIEGVPQQFLTKNVPYDNDVNVAWMVREPLYPVDLPVYKMQREQDDAGERFTYVFPKPCFIGTLTCEQMVGLIAIRNINGAMAPNVYEGTTATINAVCEMIMLNRDPTKYEEDVLITFTTPADPYGG